MNLDDPIATALRVTDALERAGERYALFGGLLLADVDDAASVLRRSVTLLDMGLIETELDLLVAEIPDWDVRARRDLIRARRS